MKEKTKGKLPTGAWIVTGILVLITIYYGISDADLGMAIFSLIFSFTVARSCKKMAEKINKSIVWAWFIGFLFILLGWLGYYIYYRIELRKMKKNETKTENKEKLPGWVWVITIFVFIYVIYEYGIFSILGIPLALIFAGGCKNMAERINKNIISAWFIGLFFSFFGWLGYYIYYKLRRKEKKKKKRKSFKEEDISLFK